MGVRVVGPGRPVLAAGEGRADVQRLVGAGEDGRRVVDRLAGLQVDALQHVLAYGRPRPEELAGLAVQRVDDAGLAGGAGQHLAHFARFQLRIDPGHGALVRRDLGVDQEPLEGVVEVPVVVDVLVVPDDLAGVHVEGHRGRHVEVVLVVPRELILGRRGGDRGAVVDQAELRVVAGRVPGPDRDPLLARGVSPGLAARLVGQGDGVGAPQLLAGEGVIGHDHAGVGAAGHCAGPAGNHLAVGDDRPGARAARLLVIVGDLGFPDRRAGPGVHRIDGPVAPGAE